MKRTCDSLAVLAWAALVLALAGCSPTHGKKDETGEKSKDTPPVPSNLGR